MSRVALVTGGSRGIGAAISKELKDAGYTVAATYAGNDEVAAAFTEETGIKTYKWNVADYDDSKAGIAKVEEDLGPIDVVVANAGITRDAPFHKMTPDQWNEVVGTNLTGVFNTIHPVWPGMRERKFGRIVVISSINGQKGQFAQVNYAATKAGDLGIVKSLAQEGARANITANAICPGYIDTPMLQSFFEGDGSGAGGKTIDQLQQAVRDVHPMRSYGTPEDIANLVTWLASDEARYASGQLWVLDGGLSAQVQQMRL